MTKKKTIITVAILAIIIAMGAFVVYRPLPAIEAFAQSATLTTSSTYSFPPAVSSSTLPDYLGSVSEVFDTFPTGPTFDIGTATGVVTVKNLYAPNAPVNMVQSVVFKETQDYLMVYDPVDSNFWIAVTVPNAFSTWRPVAEKDFLQTLGISTADACKLDVTEGVIYFAGDSNDGLSFPLTFCDTSSSTFTQ
jgi:hypothetical protein